MFFKVLALSTIAFSIVVEGLSKPSQTMVQEPTPVIFDTDMGNDIDDVFAMGMLHALQSRGECRIVAVTVSKNHELAAPFCDVLNTFYGRGDIPIGILSAGSTSDAGPYLAKIMTSRKDGSAVFPHRLKKGSDAPLAVPTLRRSLASQKDGSVVVIAIGPLTNLGNLLDSPPDKHSPLTGKALIAVKVKQLVTMAGDFSKKKAEFNVFSDSAAAKKVFTRWPGKITVCPFEMGESVHYPEMSLEKDFRSPARHPLLEANYATFGKLNGFMAWDPLATLHAIRPDRGYFHISQPGIVVLDGENVTHFNEGVEGKHQYLMPGKNVERVKEAITALASQPPSARP